MARKTFKVSVAQLTENRGYRYPWVKHEWGEAEFTASFATCYFSGRTFLKIKGGGPKGGNYFCKEDGEEYRISRH